MSCALWFISIRLAAQHSIFACVISLPGTLPGKGTLYSWNSSLLFVPRCSLSLLLFWEKQEILEPCFTSICAIRFHYKYQVQYSSVYISGFLTTTEAFHKWEAWLRETSIETDQHCSCDINILLLNLCLVREHWWNAQCRASHLP